MVVLLARVDLSNGLEGLTKLMLMPLNRLYSTEGVELRLQSRRGLLWG
jgi:hypothetical protein